MRFLSFAPSKDREYAPEIEYPLIPRLLAGVISSVSSSTVAFTATPILSESLRCIIKGPALKAQLAGIMEQHMKTKAATDALRLVAIFVTPDCLIIGTARCFILNSGQIMSCSERFVTAK
jgi:hypothetical protein